MQGPPNQPRQVLPFSTRVALRTRDRGPRSDEFAIEAPDKGRWLHRTSTRYVLSTPFVSDDVLRRSSSAWARAAARSMYVRNHAGSSLDMFSARIAKPANRYERAIGPHS